MNELVVNIVSRFNILDSSWPDNDSWKDESIKEFLLTVESAGFDVSQYIEYFHIKKSGNMDNKDDKKTRDVFEDTQTHFEASTPEDVKKWFSTSLGAIIRSSSIGIPLAWYRLMIRSRLIQK